MKNTAAGRRALSCQTAIASAIAGLVGPVMAAEPQVVTVTATKRVENLQRVPLAVTAISGEDLQERGITDILSLDKAVPGLKIANGGNDPSPILRGAGTAGTTDIAVPFYVDGIYRPRSGQGLASYLDLEQVEVLRGPQGTLFGRNTYGGLISLVPKKPSTKALAFGAAVTLGSHSLKKAEGFVNAPLGQELALRVTASSEKRDPFVKNSFNADAGLKDADNTYARAQLLWKPSSTFSANLTATTWRDTANGNADYQYKCLGIPVSAATQQLDGVNGFIDPRCGTRTGWAGGRSQAGNVSNGDVSAQAIADPYTVAFDFKPQRDISEDSVSLRMDWQVAGHALAVNAAQFKYRELRLTDSDLSSRPALVAGQLTNSKAHSLEVTLNSMATGPLKYTLGAYLYDDSAAGGNNGAFLWGYTYTTPQKPAWASWLYQGNGGTRSTAVYGQATYALTDKLSTTLGLRSSEDKRKSYTLNVIQGSRNDDLPSYGGNPTVNNGSDRHTDWRASLQYQLQKETMLYASAATGYIAGSVQAVTQTLLAPQTNKSYELGFKTTLMDGKLKLNAALFQADYGGLTTTVFVPVGAAGTILAQQVPGGTTQARGLELEARWAATDKLNVTLGLAANRSEFKRFDVSNTLGTAGSDFTTTAANGTVSGWFKMDGRKTAFSPDLTVNLGASYYFDLGSAGSITPSVFMFYSSSFRGSNQPFFWNTQPAYTTFDLSASWASRDGKYTARAYVNNATDKAVITSTSVFSRGRAMADYSSPRNLGVRLAYNF
jgi:iron complex outermembrane receptor protein